jgi:hypothetical protein
MVGFGSRLSSAYSTDAVMPGAEAVVGSGRQLWLQAPAPQRTRAVGRPGPAASMATGHADPAREPAQALAMMADGRGKGPRRDDIRFEKPGASVRARADGQRRRARQARAHPPPPARRFVRPGPGPGPDPD